ncbi:TRAP transporter large permease [Jeotgalicoccus nanhaiensis]|uniref:TRAP transporter large permease n=1 Tax=Jeotgalicoccus nanhaiensis TaxID=568603 RepID=A0ABR9XYT4_9STAP|nr:TRAP transporter large permease [Jeotgalicoccus nanhaiensis]MBF0754154.1 TRAP transporter large permease [Jeotgalicoccus nanhaiensis]TFU61341.1 TRAP transporter large permease [Jeotgalicoccus nanhaiensis]
MILGIIMFGVFLILLAIGFPVSFAMILSTLLALLFGSYSLEVFPIQTVEGIYGYTLLAVPLFILAGNLMNSAGITQKIFDFCVAIIGFVRGGLAQVNILASVIFAGISGTAVGDQAGLGAIEMRAMVEKGYSKGYSAALVLGSSVIGGIIPPSVPLIVYAYLAEVSVEELFIAGVVPGLIIAVTLGIFVYTQIISGKVEAPEATEFKISYVGTTFKKGFFALLAPVVILGGMLGGVVTPTEAGAIAAAYAIICAAIYKEFSFKNLREGFLASVSSTALIMFLVGVGTAMGWIISAEQLPQLLSNGLLSMTENKYMMLLIINILLLALGAVMEGIPIKLIMVPILLPIIDSLGIDRVHFGIVMSYNLLLGMITPPVGIGLYVISKVGKVKFEEVVKGIIPFYIPLVIALILITFFPQLSLWLPSLLSD